VEELMEENVPAFGPYDATAFADSQQYDQFDGILANSKEQALALLEATEDAQGAMLVEGPAYVVTAIRPNAKSCPKTACEEPQEGQTLRNAIYLALDVVRHRISYDRPFRHPLQKLYHEKKDDSEKVRFAIPKPKGEKKTAAAEEKAAEETKTAE
jgi:4-hydroxythreonine-4-phosphate dehydrogenase